MCRWMGWFGEPVLIEELVFKPKHGIIDQSLHARMGAEPTNGDGVGVGWYDTRTLPGLYRHTAPAWDDTNLRELAAHVESPLFLAHVRAAIGSPVQQTNCHPFRHGRWLFVHNGYVGGFARLRRELMLGVAAELFPEVLGTTDSELVFYLALTHGLEADPIAALEQTVGLIEATARRHGIPDAIQATFGVSDGTSLWAVRYATEGQPRTLYASAEAETVRRLHPDSPRLQQISDDDRLIVSEPFDDLPGDWQEIPAGSAVTVRRGGVLEERPFRPSRPSSLAGGAAGAGAPAGLQNR
jgi:predicted glutamine amidotransferase